MKHPQVTLNPASPKIAGSFGNAKSLAESTLKQVSDACDLVEIRLDLLEAEKVTAMSRPWAHLEDFPLLFTARISAEGGAGDLSKEKRGSLIETILEEAALIDIELTSADEMASTIEKMDAAGVPWVASWHDFEGRPDSFARIPAMAEEAASRGAACFKAAVRLHTAVDVANLAELLTAVKSLPLSLMGMGPLAPVSRLLCAQYGSVLNYGYIGDFPTAPGQWSAALLKQAVSSLKPVGS